MKMRLICWIAALCVLCHCLPSVFAGKAGKADSPPQAWNGKERPEASLPPNGMRVPLPEPFDAPNAGERKRGLLSTECFSSAGSQPFTDVAPNKYYCEAVYWAVRYGITNGVSSTLFAPDDPCKRMYIITFIWRGCGKPFEDEWTYPFADTYWAADGKLKPGDKVTEKLKERPEINADLVKSVTWAFRKAAPKLERERTSENRLLLEPEKTCNRGEAVIYLWKAAGCPEADMTYAENFEDIDADYKGKDNYLLELPKAVAWAAENGIAKGKTERRFAPKEATTRGNIVAFLYRFAQTPDGKRVLQLNETA